MATHRRKIARSAIRRGKRNNASKNVRHQLKTHKRKHRKIVMRGGGGGVMFIFRVPNGDRIYTLKYIVVQENILGKKDTLFIFWPMYVTDEELKAVLRKCISEDKIDDVSRTLLEDKPEIGDNTSWLNLPYYLKISATNRNYDTVSVCSFDSTVAPTLIEGALLPDFDRNTLIKEPQESRRMDNPTDLNGVKLQINMNSKGFSEKYCANPPNAHVLPWCKTVRTSIIPAKESSM